MVERLEQRLRGIKLCLGDVVGVEVEDFGVGGEAVTKNDAAP